MPHDYLIAITAKFGKSLTSSKLAKSLLSDKKGLEDLLRKHAEKIEDNPPLLTQDDDGRVEDLRLSVEVVKVDVTGD